MNKTLYILLIIYISMQTVMLMVVPMVGAVLKGKYDSDNFAFIAYWRWFRETFTIAGSIILIIFLLPGLIWTTVLDIIIIMFHIIGVIFCILFWRKDID